MLCRTAFRRRDRREVSGASLQLWGGLRQLLQICEDVRAVRFEGGYRLTRGRIQSHSGICIFRGLRNQ